MTYLIQKRRKAEGPAWAAELPNKGHLWATPGPYLRRTLLLSLARRVSDQYLQEAFYEAHTFPDLPYARNRSEEDEAGLSHTLANKVITHSEGVEDNEAN